MRKNLINDYRSREKKELHELLTKEVQELNRLKLQQGMKKNKNTREVFFKRKTIAVLKTLLRQKELIHA